MHHKIWNGGKGRVKGKETGSVSACSASRQEAEANRTNVLVLEWPGHLEENVGQLLGQQMFKLIIVIRGLVLCCLL